MRRRLLALVVITLALVTAVARPAQATTPGTAWEQQPWTGMLMGAITYGAPGGQPTYVSVSPYAGPSRVWSSPDGLTWTARTTGLDSIGLQDVAYGNGRFIAVGNDAYALTSLDGATWTQANIGAVGTMTFGGISFVNGQFMAMGNNIVNQSYSDPIVATSVDGATWSVVPMFGSVAYSVWRAPTYAFGLYVAVAASGSGGRVATSPDGVTWTRRTSASDTQMWNDLALHNGRLIAVGGGTSGQPVVMTSTDGTSWTAATVPVPTATRYSVESDGTTAIIFGRESIVSSADGVTWTAVTPPVASTIWDSLTPGNGGFVGWGRGPSNASILVTSGITGGGSASADPESWRIVPQAVPAVNGRCDAVDDDALDYGTGLAGGWSLSWQAWSGPVCVRTLVNRGQAWELG